MLTIETLLLCNHAESANGLLYLSGAGWTDLHRTVTDGAQVPMSHVGIGLTILVPWTETNRQHQLRLWIESEDGGDPIVQLAGVFEQGRPAGLPAGSEQRAVWAVNVQVQWPKAGGYRLAAAIEDADITRALTFRVHDVPAGSSPG